VRQRALADARTRLHRATAAAADAPHKQLGPRMREALRVLLASKQVVQVC
jgi:hypothetical protein